MSASSPRIVIVTHEQFVRLLQAYSLAALGPTRSIGIYGFTTQEAREAQDTVHGIFHDEATNVREFVQKVRFASNNRTHPFMLLLSSENERIDYDSAIEFLGGKIEYKTSGVPMIHDEKGIEISMI